MHTALAPARHHRYAKALVARRRSLQLLELSLEEQAKRALDDRDLSDMLHHENPRPSVDEVDAQVAVVLARRAELRRLDLDAALDRLASGRYGNCEQCDARIPAVRLLAVPETRHCLPCKIHQERRLPELG